MQTGRRTAERGEDLTGKELMGDRDGRIGIFPSWNWLYLLVIVYTLLLILLLYVLTRLLDHSIQ